MAYISDELKAKVKTAHSAREVADLLRDGGADESIAEQVWKEISLRREDTILSVDELEAVSGGWEWWDRDWLKDGCAATVEPHSWCKTNDACYLVDVIYAHRPVGTCPYCGGYQYSRPSLEEYVCSKCGKTKDWSNSGL